MDRKLKITDKFKNTKSVLIPNFGKISCLPNKDFIFLKASPEIENEVIMFLEKHNFIYSENKVNKINEKSSSSSKEENKTKNRSLKKEVKDTKEEKIEKSISESETEEERLSEEEKPIKQKSKKSSQDKKSTSKVSS